MIGELIASHTGVGGPTREAPPIYRTRYLGFEMQPDTVSGFYKVRYICRNGPADKEWLNIKEGAYFFTVDGRRSRLAKNIGKVASSKFA